MHGTRVIEFDERAIDAKNPMEADAAVTRTPGRVLAVMTADCLPVLLTDRAGTVVEFGVGCYPTPRVQIVFEP